MFDYVLKFILCVSNRKLNLISVLLSYGKFASFITLFFWYGYFVLKLNSQNRSWSEYVIFVSFTHGSMSKPGQLHPGRLKQHTVTFICYKLWMHTSIFMLEFQEQQSINYKISFGIYLRILWGFRGSCAFSQTHNFKGYDIHLE